MFEDVHNLLETADAALYGRVTYHVMESYWPTAADNPTATKHDIEHARWVNPVAKIVFSRTLRKAEWQNTRIVREGVAEEVANLKNQSGKNMVLFASPSLASTFLNLDLIDEYWFNINPVILGRGKPLCKDVSNLRNLRLLGSKTYATGVVNLRYGRA